MPDGKPRFRLEVTEELAPDERREVERMIHHALDGDPVFAIEGYEWQPGDGEKLERFVENQLKAND